MQNPAIILAPPKRDSEVNPPEKRRQYGTKEERDVSEDIYDQARAMGRVMKEYEEILFKELTVEEDSDMSSEEYEKKVQTEKRRSVVARIAKLKRERNEVNEFQGEDEAISKLISNNGPKRKIPRKFRTGADKDKEESKEPPTKDDAVSSLQLE
uniref:Uncharacterized protein n=1 Tax=Panagrolaimus sp. JU765 TaxID=591449 RepID=A0AC34QCA2_9BILA